MNPRADAGLPPGTVHVVLLGPSLDAVSGVSTHLRIVFDHVGEPNLRLSHFHVGSEGRREGRLGALLRFASSPWLLLLHLLRTRPDVVHLNTSTNRKALFRDVVYLAGARTAGCRTVLNVHGGDLPADFARSSRVQGAALDAALRWADVVVLLGEQERAAYTSFAPSVELAVVPNAVPLPPRRARSGTIGEELRLVYLGRLIRAKGLFEAVDAVAAARARGVRMRFTIGGVGPDEAALREHVLRSEVQDVVQLIGPVFGEEKEELLAESDVLLFPTAHAEGLPYALLEAMAAGVVPVSCPVGAVAEVVQSGRNGLLVPVGDVVAVADALQRLAEDGQLLAELGAAARDRVEQAYSSDRLARDLRALWRDLAERGSRRRGRSRTRA